MIPGSGSSTGEGIGYPLQYSRPSLVAEESACNVGDLGSIPGLGRSPGEGKGYPLQYSGLENSMACRVHGVAKSWTQLSNLHFSLSGNKTQNLIKENQGRMSEKLDFPQQSSTCLLSGDSENNTSRISSVSGFLVRELSALMFLSSSKTIHIAG